MKKVALVNNMRIHPDLEGKIDTDVCLMMARKIGLDQIDFNQFYKLKKTGVKNEERHRYVDKGYVVKGSPYVIGNGKDYVAIYISGIHEWFRTSPILGVKKINNESFEIETENSFYRLDLL